MTGRAAPRDIGRRDTMRRGAGHGLVILAAACLLLTGCGQKKTAASKVVEMRDMQVVDGTANDDMTDLDAVRTNGVGTGNNAAGVAPAPKAKTPPTKAPADTEAVPNE